MKRVAAAVRSTGTPMYANAYALVLNQVFSAGLGFLYWMLAARLYAVDVVGASSATISALLLIAGVAQLGLKSGMTRFVPRAGSNVTRLVASAYVVTVVAAAALSAVVVAVGGSFGLELRIGDTHIGHVWVVLAATVWSVFYLQDGVLIGLGRAPWVLVDNVLYGLSKIAVLVAAAAALAGSGIVVSWFVTTPVLILLITGLVFARFLPAKKAQLEARTTDEELTIREVVSSVMGDHLGFLVAEATVRLLPVLVVARLGAEENAYFYQAWLVATTLSLVASGMTSSFAAEAAGDRENVGAYSRGILRHMAMLVVPAAVIIGIGAPLVLLLFGPEYAREATSVLRWLAVATLPTMFITWYLGYLLVMGRVRRAVTLQITGSLLMLALSWAGLATLGITGVGVAWLVSQGLISAIAAPDALAVLRSGRSGREHPDPIDAALGTAEWRFVVPLTDLTSAGMIDSDGSVEPAGGGIEGPGDAGGHELLVAPTPTPAALAAAGDALAPGGVLCAEWSGWRTGGTRGAVTRLSEAGFEDVRVYWPAPRTGSALAWLAVWPRSELYGRAVRDMATERMPGGLARGVVMRLMEWAMRTGFVPTLVAVARTPASDSGGRPPYIPDWIAEAAGCGVGGPGATGGAVVMTTGAHRPENRVNFFAFAGEGPDLCGVGKSGTGDAVEGLRIEKEMLEGLERAGVAGAGVAVPRLVGWEELSGAAVAVHSPVIGTPLEEAIGDIGFASAARLVTGSLVELAGAPVPRPTEEWWERLIEPQLEMLSAQTRPLGEGKLAEEVRAALSGIGPVPLVWAHNDCSPWNVLVMSEGVGLLDWETGAADGLPLVDVVYALAKTAAVMDGTADTPGEAQTYARLLDRDDTRGRVFDECVNEYAARLDIAEDDIARLRVATWLEHATNDLRNLARRTEKPSSRMLDESVCVPLLRLELERFWSGSVVRNGEIDRQSEVHSHRE